MMVRSTNNLRESDLVVLENVQVHSVHFENERIPYFEVDQEGTIIKIRVHHEAVTTMAWIGMQQHRPMDVRIFPYQWAACGRSGVVNYFQGAKIHR
jgi:hypothetical protein